jgi:hypothetical protein
LQAEGEEAEEAEVAEGAEIFYTEARRLVRWVPGRFRRSSFQSHPVPRAILFASAKMLRSNDF